MIDSVVDLDEEHVDLDGSQFSESIVERWYFARVSRQNVVVHVHLVQHCLLMTWFVMGLQRIAPFYHELFLLQLWSLCFHDRNVFGTIWHIICLFQQRVAPLHRS